MVIMGSAKTSFTFLLIVLFSFLSGCRFPPQRTIGEDIKASSSDDSQINQAVAALFLPGFDTSLTLFKGLHKQASVVKFYKRRDNRPAWIDDKFQRITPLADSLADFMTNIRYYGLLPDNYHAVELAVTKNMRSSREPLLRRDVLLTDAFLSAAHDLQVGRMGKADVKFDSLHLFLLEDLLENGNLYGHLQKLEPRVGDYQVLRQKLSFILDSIDTPQRTMLLQGMMIDSLRLHKQIQALEINMERWKWENTAFGARYIIVNIPAFFARVVDHDTVVLESKVIVGTAQTPTPQLSSLIDCFITYPYWHVPRKIAVNELLPLIQRDSSYLQRHNFDVLGRNRRLLNPDSVDWKAFNSNHFPVLLRQREGPENSLGVLKFVFDNRYAVFLHDTNAPRLFRNSSRAFSHGCIRMEQARRFAHYLLTGDPDQKSPMLEKLLRQATRHYVDIPTPIPIYVRYFTAEVRNGRLYMYNDLYKKDRLVSDRLYSRQTRYYY